MCRNKSTIAALEDCCRAPSVLEAASTPKSVVPHKRSSESVEPGTLPAHFSPREPAPVPCHGLGKDLDHFSNSSKASLSHVLCWSYKRPCFRPSPAAELVECGGDGPVAYGRHVSIVCLTYGVRLQRCVGRDLKATPERPRRTDSGHVSGF